MKWRAGKKNREDDLTTQGNQLEKQKVNKRKEKKE
jgi:hypothetical protein